jgi:hypothetical protein
MSSFFSSFFHIPELRVSELYVFCNIHALHLLPMPVILASWLGIVKTKFLIIRKIFVPNMTRTSLTTMIELMS